MAKRKLKKNMLNILAIGMKLFAFIASIGAAVYVFRDKIKSLPFYKEKLEKPMEDLHEKIETKVDGSDKASAIKDKLLEWKDIITSVLDKMIDVSKDIIDLVKSKLSNEEEVATNANPVDDDFEDVFDDIDTNDREYVSLNITDNATADEVEENSSEVQEEIMEEIESTEESIQE